MDFASPGYLEALGARLLAGRLLTASDNRPDGPRVAVINDATVARFFPDGQAIGESLWIAGNTYQIIGVVAGLAGRRLDEQHQATAYVPRAFNMSQISVVVRTPLDPLSLVETVRSEVERLDAGVAVANARALDRAMQDSMTDRKLMLAMVAIFSLVALGLACIGLYGVMAYAVANRRRELGIRMALGAKRREIIGDVLGRGLRMAAAGLLVGLPVAAVAGRLLSSELYQVPPVDALALGVTGLVVLLIAVLASLIPALRAAGVDPTTALRSS